MEEVVRSLDWCLDLLELYGRKTLTPRSRCREIACSSEVRVFLQKLKVAENSAKLKLIERNYVSVQTALRVILKILEHWLEVLDEDGHPVRALRLFRDVPAAELWSSPGLLLIFSTQLDHVGRHEHFSHFGEPAEFYGEFVVALRGLADYFEVAEP